MAKAVFVRFEMPKDLTNSAYEAVEMARDTGKLSKGTNEVTKCVERGTAKFVFMAEDTSPPEILAHIPMLCEEKRIPYGYVPSKAELGNAGGLKVGTAAIAIVDPGKSRVLLETLEKRIEAAKK